MTLTKFVDKTKHTLFFSSTLSPQVFLSFWGN